MHEKLCLHWVSQTLGPDRGLQDVYEACAGLADQIEIHIRAQASEQEKKGQMALAERCGLAASVKFHPIIDHDDLIPSMAEYDVGLAKLVDDGL